MSDEIRYELEVVKWQGSIHCAYLNNLRIAGGKPWAGGQIVKKWSVTARDVIQSIPELQTLSKNYEAAKSELAALREELAKTYRSASELANAMTRDVPDLSPEFELFDYTSGVIGQIDNMYAGMRGERDKLQYSLAAAEQRNAEMVAAFTPLLKNWDDLAAGESLNVDRARTALKPTESGASE